MKTNHAENPAETAGKDGTILPFPDNDFLRCLQSARECLHNKLENLPVGCDDALVIDRVNKVLESVRSRTSSEEVSRRTSELCSIVMDLNSSARALIDGGNAECKELTEELEAVTKSLDDSFLSMLEQEIARRCGERERVSTIQENLENQKADLEEEVRILREKIKHGTTDNPVAARDEITDIERRIEPLSERIEKIILALDKNDREIAIITQYHNAVMLIKQGPPTGIIGLPLDCDK